MLRAAINTFNPAAPGAIGGTTPAAGSFTTLAASGVFTELKKASVYVYTAWDPTDVAGTATNGSSTASATSTAASYITVANSSGTTTWTAVTGGLYRFTVQMQNETIAVATFLALQCSLGGTATLLQGVTSTVGLFFAATTASSPFAAGGSLTFYANMTAAQTVTTLPKVAVSSGGATTSFTTQCTISAEYCGATAN